jgi:predicted transcriptional regulator
MTTNTTEPRLTPIQKAARDRMRLVEIIRANPQIKSRDACEKLGIPFDTARHHLYWARTYGFIKSTGRGPDARWLALPPPAREGLSIGEDPRLERLKSEDALTERRREILSYIRSHGPVLSREISEFFQITKGALYHSLRWLSEEGCIKPTNDGGQKAWEFVKLMARPGERKPAPSVGITPARSFFEPGPVITKIEAGVKYTYQAAPKGRFHVDLPPTGGVISYDHPRLTAALTQRTAQV